MNPGSSWSLLIAAVEQKSEQRKRLNLAKACRTLEAFDLSMRLLHLVYLLRWKVAFVFGLRACFCQVHVFQCLRLDSESQLQCTTQASSPERKLPVAINIRRSTCCLKRVQKTQNCCSHARGSFFQGPCHRPGCHSSDDPPTCSNPTLKAHSDPQKQR